MAENEVGIDENIPIGYSNDHSSHIWVKHQGYMCVISKHIPQTMYATTVELPKEVIRYTLAGYDGMHSTVMTLNGRYLVLCEYNELPDLSGEAVSGKIELALAHLLLCNLPFSSIKQPRSTFRHGAVTVISYSFILSSLLITTPMRIPSTNPAFS